VRVLISTSTFPLREGDGLPRFVHELARALSERCEVSVLAPGAPGVPERERWDGVEIERFAYALPRGAQRLAYGYGMGENLRRSWLARSQVPGFVWCQARALRALLRRRRFDVVNSHWMVPQGLSAALVRGSAGFPHVVTLHGGDAYLLARLPLARPLVRFVVGRSDALLAVSGNVREQLDAALGRESGAELLPMGVDTQRFAPATAPAASPFPAGFLLYVGRLAAIKGVSVLLRALPRVREAHPGLGLVVVGRGAEEAALRREAAALGLAGAVRFEGARGPDAVAGWLRGCRVVVLPSLRRGDGRAEGLPAVLLEALASGARVVATATGGMPELLRHGENGWLCRDGDPDDLAGTILAALADPPDSALPERARASALALGWPAVAARTLALFERVSRG
jgi:glycosyltransferase involved in cell wall biosynthesis